MQPQRVCHDTLPWLISFSLGLCQPRQQDPLWIAQLRHKRLQLFAQRLSRQRHCLNFRISSTRLTNCMPSVGVVVAAIALILLGTILASTRRLLAMVSGLLPQAGELASSFGGQSTGLPVSKFTVSAQETTISGYPFRSQFICLSPLRPNQSMKPTAPFRNKFRVIALTPSRGLSLSR